jgi:hypothetical protein
MRYALSPIFPYVFYDSESNALLEIWTMRILTVVQWIHLTQASALTTMGRHDGRSVHINLSWINSRQLIRMATNTCDGAFKVFGLSEGTSVRS